MMLQSSSFCVGDPPPQAKQPWEMTRGEYRTAELRDDANRIQAAGRDQIAENYRRAADAMADASTRRQVEKGFFERFVKYDNAHHDAIKAALAEGKPVPPEVLADYRDLQKKALESEIKACGDAELQDFAKHNWDRTWKNLFDVRLDMAIARKRGAR